MCKTVLLSSRKHYSDSRQYRAIFVGGLFVVVMLLCMILVSMGCNNDGGLFTLFAINVLFIMTQTNY